MLFNGPEWERFLRKFDPLSPDMLVRLTSYEASRLLRDAGVFLVAPDFPERSLRELSNSLPKGYGLNIEPFEGNYRVRVVVEPQPPPE